MKTAMMPRWTLYTLFMNRTTGATVPEVEPNGSITNATPLVIGSVITGSIAITSDDDIYVFTAAANDHLVIQTDGDPERDGTV